MSEEKLDIRLTMNEVGQVMVGVMDCFFSLGVALVDAGVVTRQELAEAFETITAQQQARPDGQNAPRQMAAKTLARLFRAEVVTSLS